jgi:phosphoglycerol geranylgeranyltransferase
VVKIGKIEKYINEKIEKEKQLFVLIDPVDYKGPADAINTGIQAAEGGAGAVVIGGSIGVQGDLLELVTKSIKDKINVPIILFPGNIATLTRQADALYFMSLLNSRNAYWISQAQTLASAVVKQMNIEPLPVGYIVVEPGGSVGWVGDVNLVPRDRPKLGVGLALAAQYMGSRIVLMDVGSGSKVGPVPPEMIGAVRHAIDIPLIAAGGMRSAEDARMIAKAGADVVQMGTIFQGNGKVKETVQKIVKAINEK